MPFTRTSPLRMIRKTRLRGTPEASLQEVVQALPGLVLGDLKVLDRGAGLGRFGCSGTWTSS